MIDLHCHLLHGVDDGPDSLDESLELCRIAVADGIGRAVVTPHIHPGRWDNDRLSAGQACAALQRELDSRCIPLQLGFAAEVRLTEFIPEQIAEGHIPFYGEIGGFRVMLLEFPHGHLIPGSDRLIEWLLEQGIRPLLAHPERNRQVMRDPAQLRPFIERGCWLQVTASSLTGQFGQHCRYVACQLLEQGAVKVLASDGHNARTRPPVLSGVFDYVAQKYGRDLAQQLFVDEPAAIAGAQFR
ncbi:MAG: capsular biosynthesis protein [Halioglobus sp.]|nr:capsular biosynthesis protein [Halioglobus sp.]